LQGVVHLPIKFLDFMQKKQYFLRLLLLFGLYFITGFIGLKINAVSGFATVLWPPAGIALTALLLFGYSLWPAITLAAFLVNLFQGASPWLALAISIGNTLQPVWSAWILRKLKFHNSMTLLKDLFYFVCLAVLLGTLISSTLGVFWLNLAGIATAPNVLKTWLTWWAGDMLGVMVITPFVLSWKTLKVFKKSPKTVVLEAIVLTLFLIAFTVFIFGGKTTGVFESFAFPFLLFPLIIWAALRFAQPGASWVIFVIYFISVFGVAQEGGFYRDWDFSLRLLHLQVFLILASVTGLVLAVAIEEKRAALLSLKNTNQELEQFTYISSHDLQEPLRMISSYTQMLAKKYEGRLDPGDEKYMGYILDGAHRMHALIKDLLSYTRIDGDKVDPTPVSIDEVIKTQLMNLKLKIDEKKAIIKFHSLPKVPGNAAQLSLLFQNLIGNALKFSNPQKPPEITITAEKQNDQWRFKVRDNGIGIPTQYQKQIFEIFKRLHSKEAYEGTGIGLTTCKKIVERHGGKIWVESEVGKGSTFYFTLPA
jgi:signal transduction histidine kinase